MKERAGIVRTVVQRFALCYWGMQLQIARLRVMVGSRRQWVADGGAVLLGNAIAGC